MSDTPSPHDTYTSPLAARNASPEMLKLWSPRHKFNTWRRIWLAVAEAQHEVTKDRDGGPLVTKAQVEALRAVVERGITDAELARAAELERDLRHDVMAHVHCLGESCPEAKAIIHLGCTSQDVVCNADLLTINQALGLIESKCARATVGIADSARKFVEIPTLAYTHYQVAQPTTVGRRMSGWAFDLSVVSDPRPDEFYLTTLRGFRGATGTQASFLQLLGGEPNAVDEFEGRAVSKLLPDSDSHLKLEDSPKAVEALRRRIASNLERAQARFGERWYSDGPERLEQVKQMSAEDLAVEHFIFVAEERTFSLTGQTYPRALDALILSNLASTAAVLHKIATDIRLLSNRKEIDEPFGSKQIGSSAMPYKRNPMKCERICGLARFVMNLVGNAYDTAATQWLERTLDDSSNRRLSLPEAFLALDGALDLMHQVASGLVVHEAMVRRNLMAELPFLATEHILMEAVKAGGDRQEYHEIIRAHAQEAGLRVKSEGLDNDLLDRLQADAAFHPPALNHELDWSGLMDPMRYVGRSVEQTERFLAEVIEPLRERYADELAELGGSDRGV